MKILPVFKSYGEALMQLIYPIRTNCVICRKYLSKEAQYSICGDCIAEFPFIKGWSLTPAGENNCYAAADFKGPVKKLMHAFKYEDKTYLSRILAKMMAEVYCKENLKADYILAVPMHKERMKERGYNQSDLLAKYISKELNIHYLKNELVRIKNTRIMHTLNRSERKENVAHAFKVINKERINGKDLLLIDDIFTTGATAEACSKALKQAGADKTIVLTFARGILGTQEEV